MTPTPIKYSPDMLMKQNKQMLLIDEVVDVADNWIKTQIHHRPGCTFANENGIIPAWIGLEYMCQTVLAQVGYQRLETNKPIKIGFVLGTKKFSCSVASFKIGQPIFIEAEEYMANTSDLGVHNCRIIDPSGNELASAMIKGAMPDDPLAIIKQHRSKLVANHHAHA